MKFLEVLIRLELRDQQFSHLPSLRERDGIHHLPAPVFKKLVLKTKNKDKNNFPQPF